MSEHLRGSYYQSSPPEMKLVLLGNLGCGKTSSADTILGKLSPVSPTAARSCQMRQGVFENRSLTLVEAPRWYWNGGKMDDSVRKETERVGTLVSAGIHGILLLVPVYQFTEMEGFVPAVLEEIFGEESLDHTLVLLTCGDYLMGRTVEEYLQKEHPGLRQIIQRCGGRYHVINNRQRQDRDQVRELLEKVDNMVQKNGVYHIKTPQERDLEKRVKDRKRELMESYRAQKEERREAAASTHIRSTEVQRSIDRGQEHNTTWEKRRQEREAIEGRVSISQASNGVHSTPVKERQSYSEQQDNGQMKRTPSFRLNADGAILSQLYVGKSNQKVVSTFHHRINSFEERSPEVSPTTSPHSPVFSSSSLSSSTARAAFASSFPSSSPSSSSPFSAVHDNSASSFPSSTSVYSSKETKATSPSSSLSSTSVYSSKETKANSPSSFLPPTSVSSSTHASISPSSSLSSTSVSSSTFGAASASPSSSSTPELRLVLLGRSGAGKSTAGNSILGRKEFESRPDSLTSITQKCEKKKVLTEGRTVAVVDTPDWFNSEQAPDDVRAQISSCVALSSPGPHIYLLCVPLDQPAKTELQTLKALETVFGPEAVQKYTLILFTYADRLKASGKTGNNSVEEYIANQRGDLLNLVEKCRDRFHVMECGGGGRDMRNVAELLEKVEQTVKEAGGEYYSCPAYQEAENRVRQKQVEIAKEKRSGNLEREKLGGVGQLSTERQALYSYMQPVAEAEEEVREDEIEKTRDEAEMCVSSMNIESLPPITLSNLSPSLFRSILEKMESSAKMLPKLVSDGSVWVGEGAKKVKSSEVWGTVGNRAQNIQKMMAESSAWQKVGTSAGHVSKLVGDRVPKVVVDGSTWVGSGAKAVAASPMWEKVGSGAKLVANGSMHVGSGIGAGAKNLAQSPVWGKVGSGAKTGAKLVADGSMRVGAGIGAGAKKVAQSPVWEKVGSGAKAGAKMVSESSVWEKIGTKAKQVPKVVIGGAILGLVLGVFFGGVIGGAVGAAAGSAVTEVGRRKFSKKNMSEKTEDAAQKVERTVNDSMNSLVKQGGKVLKTE